MKVKMFVTTLRSDGNQPDVSKTEDEINGWMTRHGGKIAVHSIVTSPFGGTGTWLLTTVLYGKKDG